MTTFVLHVEDYLYVWEFSTYTEITGGGLQILAYARHS